MFSLPLKILALVIFLSGYAFGSYALIENCFVSAMVRLQTERGQQPNSNGFTAQGSETGPQVG